MNTLIKQCIPRWLKKWIKTRREAAKTIRMLADAETATKAVGNVDAAWRRRINDVLACPDNAFLPRVHDAGMLKGHLITMHNGIKVSGMGYYGAGILNMLIENKGVHEPQEERAFMEVLKHLAPGSKMLELGAYWGYYSLWLMSEVQGAECYLVEPDVTNMMSGKMNFKINGRRGVFENAFVGAEDFAPKNGIKTISVDGFCARHSISHLQILHSDIQGAEMQMLTGAKRMLSEAAVDYVFISTHSKELHYGCIDRLKGYRYQILAEADQDNTYSHDGLIIAKSHQVKGLEHLDIAGKTKVNI